MRRPILTCARRDRRGQAGLTLVELMVAMTISLLILAALVALFTNTSRSNREFARANGMIESGRLAIQVLEADVQHAGFCLETQGFPNAVNVPGWEAQVVLRPGQAYRHVMVHAFTAEP